MPKCIPAARGRLRRPAVRKIFAGWGLDDHRKEGPRQEALTRRVAEAGEAEAEGESDWLISKRVLSYEAGIDEKPSTHHLTAYQHIDIVLPWQIKSGHSQRIYWT